MTATAVLAVTPIAEVTARSRVRIQGRVRSIRVRPWGDSPTLEVTLVDESGGLTLVFLARRRISGIALGTMLVAEGVAGAHQRRLAILNPSYELVPRP